MTTEIDQGTVIYGIRSSKYPDVPCYGIIITARCDIAQNKVPKYYYLVAVDASTWFCTEHGYNQTFSQQIQDLKSKISSVASALELNGDVLLSCSEKEQNAIIADKNQQIGSQRKAKDNFKNLKKHLSKYREFVNANSNVASRKTIIKAYSKTAISHLKEIDRGAQLHYYFLPQTSYLQNGIKNKGLIVDLLEIGTLSLTDAKKLINPLSKHINTSDLPDIPKEEDIPYLQSADDLRALLRKLPEYLRLKHKFWLEDPSDFVAIEGTTQSPWCEHLMQRFSNAFIRIGLENPSSDDFKSIILSSFGEDNQ